MKIFTRIYLLVAAWAVMGTMAQATNTECNGALTTASQGAFTNGYKYTFTTVGADVTFTCECLDSKVGLVAYAWTFNPAFSETQMTQGTGQSFSKTFIGQTPGATFNVACKFAYSGGMSVTTTLSYTVGSTCSGVVDNVKPVMASASIVGLPTYCTANLHLSATDNITSPVNLFQAVDATNGISKVLTTDASGNATITGLSSVTSYNFTIKAIDGGQNYSDNSILVVFTTATSPLTSGIDFETSATGAGWGWNTFDFGSIGGYTLVSNPASTGINSSATCGELSYDAGSSHWVGVQTAHGDFGTLTLNANNSIVSMMVYKSQISPVGFKLATNSNWAQAPIYATNKTINQWELLTFDMSAYIGTPGQPGPYDQICLHPDATDSRAAGVFYFDNIKFGSLTNGISDIQANNSFKLYQNSMSGIFTVTSDLEISQLIVRNLVGQTIKVVSAGGSVQNLNLSDLSIGNYLVTAKFSNGQQGTQKIIKF